MDAAINNAVCLVWRLSEDTLISPLLKIEMLQALHQEMQSWADLLELMICERGATSGMLLRSKSQVHEEDEFTAEDRLVRFGQLVGRWAQEKGSFFKVQMGVHGGEVAPVEFLGDIRSFFGEAVSLATALSCCPLADICVLLSGHVRNKLIALQQLRFGVGEKQDTFELDPDAEVSNEVDVSGRKNRALRHLFTAERNRFAELDSSTPSYSSDPGRMSLRRINSEGTPVLAMTLDEFTHWLSEHNVDIRKYGKGKAQSIEELYKLVVVDGLLKLESNDDGILRLRLESARIHLIMTSSDGKQHQVRLLNEIDRKGQVKGRNQLLSCSMISRSVDSGLERAKRIVTEFLETTFALPADVQARALIFASDKYEAIEETIASSCTPDITIVYVTHLVEMLVNDISCPELNVIGLPSLECFPSSPSSEDGNAKRNYGWYIVGEVQEEGDGDELALMLRKHGILSDHWPIGRFAELYDEIHCSKYAQVLESAEGVLERTINIVRVWVCCSIYGVDHLAVMSWKTEDTTETHFEEVKMEPVTLRMLQTWDWKEAVFHALLERLGLNESFVEENLYFDEENYRHFDEIDISKEYPGLTTRYHIHEVSATILGEDLRHLDFLGLPDGTEFIIKRPTSSASWCWVPTEMTKKKTNSKAGFVDKKQPERKAEEKRQLPIPSVPQVTVEKDGSPCPVLASILRNRQTDKAKADNAARRIRDKSYTCEHFYNDCVGAFPELICYAYSSEVSSGRTTCEEYQRTFGALFAFYWLMRLDIDGAQSFCFGVGEDWKPLSATDSSIFRPSEEIQKRQSFVDAFEWTAVEDLFVDAGILRRDGNLVVTHDIDLTLAMLVLTAIHDIMKVRALLPVVQEGHGQLLDHEVGDLLNDHDEALAYVLEHYGDLLPSYTMLTPAQRKQILFTQCKMDYNMGWLVQAEAPPGALFSKFKQNILSGGATPEDVAFYFVHWLTDLAGAEPYPQDGCEKFVLKFPMKVLNAFLSSFSTVQNLSSKSETAVYEDYLKWRWSTYEIRELGPVPNGRGSVAIMRLVIMAQGMSKEIVQAYHKLEKEDRELLNDELSHTACSGQSYACEGDESQERGGPGFLIYYSPALMQKAGRTDPCGALKILADVFRQARELFPLSPEYAGESVTVHIDVLKELQVAAIMAPAETGDVWIVRRIGSWQAEVVRGNLLTDSIDRANERVLLSKTPKRKGGVDMRACRCSSLGRSLSSRVDRYGYQSQGTKSLPLGNSSLVPCNELNDSLSPAATRSVSMKSIRQSERRFSGMRSRSIRKNESEPSTEMGSYSTGFRSFRRSDGGLSTGLRSFRKAGCGSESPTEARSNRSNKSEAGCLSFSLSRITRGTARREKQSNAIVPGSSAQQVQSTPGEVPSPRQPELTGSVEATPLIRSSERSVSPTRCTIA